MQIHILLCETASHCKQFPQVTRYENEYALLISNILLNYMMIMVLNHTVHYWCGCSKNNIYIKSTMILNQVSTYYREYYGYIERMSMNYEYVRLLRL